MTTKRPSQAVGEQIRLARKARDWRQEDLVARLEEIGAHGWRQSKIAKIERGEVKRLTLDEFLELAAALGVEPARLLVAGDDVAVTSSVALPPFRFLNWMRGLTPLAEEDERVYRTVLISDDEWSDLVDHPTVEADLRDFPKSIARRFQAEEATRQYGRDPQEKGDTDG